MKEMIGNNLYSYFEKALEEIKKDNQYRYLKPINYRNGKYVNYKNKKYINLSSNDYLGIATDREALTDFYSVINKNEIIDLFGLGSTSSRLLTGDFALYSELEKILSDLYNGAIKKNNSVSQEEKQSLVFNSGYHANIGIISTLTDKDDLILSDKLNHASIIDGTRLSKAKCIPFDHFNYDQIIKILEEEREKYKSVMIISESVFSMDGDIAGIRQLVEIKNKYNTLLYIDEAHAVGLFGETGLGICEREKAIHDVDIIVGTFGKALASLGAFVITNPILKDYLVNKMRTLLYTTALPPAVINWNIFNIKRLPVFKEKRMRVLDNAKMLRNSLIDKGIKTNGESQIVPAITGDKAKTLKKTDKLQERGFLLFPIRPPTVPAETSRIRISLTTDIEWDDIKEIPEILS